MIKFESLVMLSVGEEASSSRVGAAQLTAEEKNEDDAPAKRAAGTAKKEQGRSAGSTTFKLDDLYVVACRVAIVEGKPIGVHLRISKTAANDRPRQCCIHSQSEYFICLPFIHLSFYFYSLC